MFCTGYLSAWFSNLHDFRRRSLVERILWSIPLSVAVSPIFSVLIGKLFSLTAVSAFFLFCSIVWLALVGREWLQLRHIGKKWIVGLQPLGILVTALALIWVAIAIFSVVDMESSNRLFTSLLAWDHSYRVSWTQSILRTGIPPSNPFYFYKHAAPMRNYYFWYVLCASVARISHLPARAVVTSSCVWSGFALAALIGLYLKHFLGVGTRLRRQFILAILCLPLLDWTSARTFGASSSSIDLCRRILNGGRTTRSTVGLDPFFGCHIMSLLWFVACSHFC